MMRSLKKYSIIFYEILIIFSIIFGFEISTAQSLSDTTYYPLKVGNSWTYKFIAGTGKSISLICGDTIMKNKKKYYYNDIKPDSNTRFERIDSSGKTWLYDSKNWDNDTTTNELLMEDFSLPDGAEFVSCRFRFPSKAIISRSIRLSAFTNELTTLIHIKHPIPYDWPINIGFEKGIGMIISFHEISGFELESAIINGKKFSRAVKVDKLENSYNPELSLSQNYPNPFNSSTIIKYSIPKKSSVFLSIYDILGKEVNRFEPGEQEAGEYTFNLSAENWLSGVYFCKLVSGNNFKIIKLHYVK